MTYLLDTNICIYLLNRKLGYERILSHVDGRDYGEIAISAITLAEIEYGIAKSLKKPSNKAKLEYFLYQFECLPFDNLATSSYGSIRVALESKGTPIGPLDTLIAAHAYSLEATIITNNVKEFKRVANLKIENWLDTSEE